MQQYRARLSGPLLDRVDMHVDVPRLRAKDLAKFQRGDDSATVAKRVMAAYQRQITRCGSVNARLSPALIRDLGIPGAQTKRLLYRAVDKFGLSVRSCDRILRVAMTIADLDDSDDVQPAHLGEALALRQADSDAFVRQL